MYRGVNVHEKSNQLIFKLQVKIAYKAARHLNRFYVHSDDVVVITVDSK